MSIIEINLFGNCFTHLTHGNKGFSVHGKQTDKIKWVFDGSGIFNVFTQDAFHLVDKVKNGKKNIGWILEPKDIIPGLYKNLVDKKDLFFNYFDAIYTHNEELINIDERFKFVLGNGFWITQPKIYEKNKNVSMICSSKSITPQHKKRIEIANKYKNQLDLFGRGFNPITTKEEGLCDYMFSVVVENDLSDTWITEKVLDCFATGTIPIYFGTKKITEFFNKDGIIFYNDNMDLKSFNDQLYYSKLDAVKENLEKVIPLELPETHIFNKIIENIGA